MKLKYGKTIDVGSRERAKRLITLKGTGEKDTQVGGQTDKHIKRNTFTSYFLFSEHKLTKSITFSKFSAYIFSETSNISCILSNL